MADPELRELEHRFRETGSLEDETRWLQGCLRVGSLSEVLLGLAAGLGHPPALQLRPQTPLVWDDFGELRILTKRICLRLALAAARAVAHLVPEGMPFDSLSMSRDAVECLLIDDPHGEAWDVIVDLIPGAGEAYADKVREDNPRKGAVWTPLSSAGAEHFREEYRREIEPHRGSPARSVKDWLPIARSACHPDDFLGWVLESNSPTGVLADVHLTWSVEPDPTWPSTRLRTSVAHWVERDVLQRLEGDPAQAAAEWCTVFALIPVTLQTHPHLNALSAYPLAAAALGSEPARAAIREEVVPWLLGRGDPLAERVAARRA